MLLAKPTAAPTQSRRAHNVGNSWAAIRNKPLSACKNGGWYRDRTCDPYHVKVQPLAYLIELSTRTVPDVRETFALGSRQSWAIVGANALPERQVPRH